jgi:N-acetylmuramoyl-L-alanine amidase
MKRLLTAGLVVLAAALANAQPTPHEHTPSEPFHYAVPEGEPLAGMKICVDAGHGGQAFGSTRGYTGGTRSAVSDLTESDANLRASLMLWNLLTQAGAEVVMTRTFETRLSEDCFDPPGTEAYRVNQREELNVRVRVAENNDCDLILSVHHNAVGEPTVNFATAFFFDPAQHGGTGAVTHPPANVALSRELSDRIVAQLGEEMAIPTRPAAHGNFHVLRESRLPAIIVECSFMTNPEEAERLDHLHRSRQEAIAIFEAVLEQFAQGGADR